MRAEAEATREPGVRAQYQRCLSAAQHMLPTNHVQSRYMAHNLVLLSCATTKWLRGESSDSGASLLLVLQSCLKSITVLTLSDKETKKSVESHGRKQQKFAAALKPIFDGKLHRWHDTTDHNSMQRLFAHYSYTKRTPVMFTPSAWHGSTLTASSRWFGMMAPDNKALTDWL